MLLHLITYGCGAEFVPSKFKPVRNTCFVKPKGDLWASPIDAKFGWYDWCKSEDFGDLSRSFTFDFEGNIFVIDDAHSAANMPWIKDNRDESLTYPDFETMDSLGYDAIYLTAKGEKETRWGYPSLYG